MNAEPILRVENVVKTFGDITALAGVSVDVKRGEIVCFLGPSGCGKTTLLRVIGGFYEQEQGNIYLDGELINGVPPEKRDTVMFFQNYALFPHMTVFENVTYGLRVRRVPRPEIKQRAADILSLIQLEGMEERFPNQLSGGQQQRVALARALILNPKLLLLDEPLSNLDAKLRSYMRDEITKIRENLNLTIIFVTHDQEEAMSIADKIAVMRGGLIEQIGHPLNIYRYPDSTYVANFVGSANFLKATVTGADHKGSVEIDTAMGRLKMTAPQKDYTIGETVVAVIRPENVRVIFGTETDHEHAGGEALSGTVLKGTYLGSLIIYTIKVRDEIITVTVPNPTEKELRATGENVRLVFPEYIHLIEAAKAAEILGS
ncbi:MAG: ABC transporter ATP-binding protein [Dethiobacteria bacterium]|nr:ABC transporter ATP-binding protein [Dethiobacteria bacterium]